MSDIHTYKLTIEHKETILPDEVRESLENNIKVAVNRFIGLSFNVFGECNYGKVISARLVFEHSSSINPDKLGAALSNVAEGVRIAEILKVD